MDHASVSSSIIPHLDGKNAEKTITDFFNGAFYLMLPWVNEMHPYNITKFEIPKEIPNLVKIDDLEIDIRDDYASFSLSPEFILKPPGDEKGCSYDNKLYLKEANYGKWDIMWNLR